MSSDQSKHPITTADAVTREVCFAGNAKKLDSAAVIISAARNLKALLGPVEGACYRYALFLRLFLKEHFDIDGEAVVGFVNDGSNEVYSSHAWFEYEGRKTDLAISRPLMSELPGPLTIHGVELAPGHAWTYHRRRTKEGELLVKMLLNSGHRATSVLCGKEAEHNTMTLISEKDNLIRWFLGRAPDGFTYRRLATAVKNGMVLATKL